MRFQVFNVRSLPVDSAIFPDRGENSDKNNPKVAAAHLPHFDTCPKSLQQQPPSTLYLLTGRVNGDAFDVSLVASQRLEDLPLGLGPPHDDVVILATADQVFGAVELQRSDAATV